ncbi:murein transglycosylase A [Azospirillum rugosum]|uniref:peptidoglycan lytic exotransglycosylase n=1 Tax=Azospirillum rugosum TaxID=416170 RepID=A0ABS4SMT0_9PROT|nr:murein transglycosylase A [Azospirillum rugosum]MBP2293864.1 membrane-bound lytic murein transglycosylase A [Azospirillum rugosum]MDQ0526949.1 membrane-bound lytic murein transglycosylase A [Azospirillum rugosum]
MTPTSLIRFSAAAALAAAFFMASCERKEEAKAPPPPDKLVLKPVAFTDLPGWTADRVADAVPAFRRSCAKLAALPADRPVGPDGVGGRGGDWQAPCAALAKQPAALGPGDDAAARAFFEQWFTPYAAANNDTRRGLFTGYYEVELAGSRTPDPAFPVPLYKRPSDLVLVDLGDFADRWKGERTAGRVIDGRLKPFEDRAAIEAGALRNRGLELLWLQDPIATFFLHIQGSGRVRFPDGTETRVGYAAQNGHKYVAIGKALIDRGEIPREQVSLQSIRAWLKAHPDKAPDLMNMNPSYVFFQELKGEGPNGAQNVALTPGRSLAVDSKFLPYGVPVWLDAEDPLDSQARLRRLLVAQDTGGAIRGPVRGDVFWGHGEEAEKRAGVMKSAGEYYVLLPKTVVPAS